HTPVSQLGHAVLQVPPASVGRRPLGALHLVRARSHVPPRDVEGGASAEQSVFRNPEDAHTCRIDRHEMTAVVEHCESVTGQLHQLAQHRGVERGLAPGSGMAHGHTSRLAHLASVRGTFARDATLNICEERRVEHTRHPERTGPSHSANGPVLSGIGSIEERGQFFTEADSGVESEPRLTFRPITVSRLTSDSPVTYSASGVDEPYAPKSAVATIGVSAPPNMPPIW